MCWENNFPLRVDPKIFHRRIRGSPSSTTTIFGCLSGILEICLLPLLSVIFFPSLPSHPKGNERGAV